ncbi:MAG TPA: dual specificity protein phosphatase family protein [Gemmataceae bacterium]|nr:dual specificity protein phosphatase family protein [Gemmataceae bacterium]
MALSPPDGFSWIDRPHLAACARPSHPDEFAWLRQQGIQILLTLSEERPRRDWVDAAGLLVVHVPIIDMDAPTQEQLDRAASTLERARSQGMGVAVHCTAGLGRTGSILAAYFVAQGFTPTAAIARVRELRPGSIETPEQEVAIREFARRRQS